MRRHPAIPCSGSRPPLPDCSRPRGRLADWHSAGALGGEVSAHDWHIWAVRRWGSAPGIGGSARPGRPPMKGAHMTEPVPDTEIIGAFSSLDAKPTEWSQALHELTRAEVYWLSTVRPDGRSHVTPLLAIWLEGALYSCTGPNERKAKNLSANRHCVLTTGQSTLNGLDLVIEGTAESANDPAELGRVANTYEAKYGSHSTAPDGTWSGLGDAIRRAEVLVYRVAPETGFGFGKGGTFSQTRWSF